MNDQAIAAAIEQAKLDSPNQDHFRGHVLATEADRLLVVVHMYREKLKIMPNPVALYAVSLDCQRAWRVPGKEGRSYGFHPELRK